jgi:hypothetical protein
MEAANDTGAVAQPLDEVRARKNIAKMKDTELGITTAHPFQLDAVLALAYKHSSLLLIRAPGDGKSAVVHAAMRLLRGVAIVVDPTLSVGANQAISATTAGLFAVHWDGLRASSQRHLLRMLLALKEWRDTTLVIYISPEALDGKELGGAVTALSQKGIISLAVVDKLQLIAARIVTFQVVKGGPPRNKSLINFSLVYSGVRAIATRRARRLKHQDDSCWEGIELVV